MIESLQTFLVYPNKGELEPRGISGTEVPLEGDVFKLLQDVYSKSDRECRVDISFNQAADGGQQNDCRDLLMAYANNPTIAMGLPLATRLGGHTTKRSALGLLFLATGMAGAQRKILIARFAANSGILADENREALSIQFIERVFLRSIHSYKAVVYQDELSPAAYWAGKAIDRQINSTETEVSRYWISDFLASDLRTTAAQGTRVLAVAMRTAARKSQSLDVKKEISAAAALGGNLNGQVTTAREFLNRFGLSPQSREEIVAQMRNEVIINEQFRFSAEEFNRQLPYRTVELDTGAILTASAADFDQLFHQGEPDEAGRVTYSTTGRVISQKLEKLSR